MDFSGLGSPKVLRETYQPVVGCVQFNLTEVLARKTDIRDLSIALHEIGHVLGIGTLWYDFIQKSSGDAHFNGPLAIAAFDDAGGRNYTGAKVQVERDGAHWRQSILDREFMSRSSGWILSAITIQALADLGYNVDATQANSYTMDILDPNTLTSAAGKASAKIAAPSTHAQPEFSCGVGEQREPIYVMDEQGRIVHTLGD